VRPLSRAFPALHVLPVRPARSYVYGGRGVDTEGSVLSELAVFDPTFRGGGVWTLVKGAGEVPRERWLHASTVMGESLVIFGGCARERERRVAMRHQRVLSRQGPCVWNRRDALAQRARAPAWPEDLTTHRTPRAPRAPRALLARPTPPIPIPIGLRSGALRRARRRRYEAGGSQSSALASFDASTLRWDQWDSTVSRAGACLHAVDGALLLLGGLDEAGAACADVLQFNWGGFELALDGERDEVMLPHPPSLLPTGAYCVECWVCPTKVRRAAQRRAVWACVGRHRGGAVCARACRALLAESPASPRTPSLPRAPCARRAWLRAGRGRADVHRLPLERVVPAGRLVAPAAHQRPRQAAGAPRSARAPHTRRCARRARDAST
jgi:hypothetical protein